MKIMGPGVTNPNATRPVVVYEVGLFLADIPIILMAETTQERGCLRAMYSALKEVLPPYAVRLDEDSDQRMSLVIFHRQLG